MKHYLHISHNNTCSLHKPVVGSGRTGVIQSSGRAALAVAFTLALLGFTPAATAADVTLLFSATGVARATGFSNSAAVTGINDMRWGLIVDTVGDGFRPGEYDGGFSINTSGFLTVNGTPTNDYYVAHPNQVLTFTSGAAGTDPGGAGTITAITGVPYDGGTAITSGDPFQLVWFETGAEIGHKYGMLGNTSGTATFVIPSVGAAQPYSDFFAGSTADPIRGTTHTLVGSPISPIANTTTSEDTPTLAIPFTVGFVGVLSASSNNTTLVPNANLSLGGSGSNRTITATPAPNENGSAVITVTDGMSTLFQTFTLTVSAVNDVPSFTKGPDQYVQKNPGAQSNPSWATAISAGPANESAQIVNFIVSNNNNALFSTQPAIAADGTLSYTPAADSSGSAEVNVQIHDDGGVDSAGIDTSATQTFTINVLDNAFAVTSAADTGGGTLRQILANAAVAGGMQTITFVNGFSGPIVLSSEIVIDSDVTLDASSVPGGVTINGGTGDNRIFRVNSGRSLTLIGLTLTSGNLNTGSGGAIFNDGTLTLTQCTLSGNSASASGGAIFNGGTLTLRHCTVAGNSANTNGGGVHVGSGKTLFLENSIVAGNSGGAGADIFNGGGTINTRSANLIGNNDTTGIAAGALVGTQANPVNPLLSPLGNYGGLTQTMPPLPGSPAIDQASVLSPALTTDQRGSVRPLGLRPDLGAVEADIILVTTAVDELDNPGTPGTGVSLREAVRDVPTGGTIAFDRALFTGATATTNTITLTRGPLNPQRNCTLNGSANLGGMTILTQLVITQQPQSLSVLSDAAANFGVTVTSVNGGVAYQWRKGSVNNATTTPAFNIASAQESDEGVYDVVLSESVSPGTLSLVSVTKPAATLTSQPASLIVGGALVMVQRSPSSAMIALNSSHTLSVVAVGPATPALTYQWTLNTKNISGATKASYLIAKAALTHAGTYRCVVKSGTVLPGVTSDLAEIGVVDTTPKTLNLLASATASFTATVNAAGTGTLTYAWLKNGGGTAFNTKSFTIKPALITDSGLYTCTVSGAAGVFIGGAPTQLNVSDAAPQFVLPLVMPAATIGQAYLYQLPVQSIVGAPATSFSVTGALPTGLVFNTTTGMLSGRPTVTKVGGYALSFKAINAKASSALAPATLIVNAVPTNAVGVFVGPVERSPLNDNLGGRFDLTTTAAGGFSGSLTLGARAKLPITAQLLQSAGAGDVILYGNIPGLTMADKTPLTAYIEVFVLEQLARLTLIHPNGTTLVIPAWRNQWDKVKLATAYAAYYTMRLDPELVGNPPRGYGYASFTVKTDGTLTLAGKLPDGSDVTGSTFVGPEGQILLFNLLYTNRGSHVGQFTLTPASPVTNNTVSGATSWFKPGPLLPTSTDTVYKDGFGPLTVTAAGGVYVPPAKGLRVMGLGTVPNPNAKLNFTLGGLAPEFTQLLNIVNPSATGLTNTAVITAPITNTTKVTTLNAATGAFVGSFQINGAAAALNRPAPFFGQIVKIGATTEGYGYFLLPTVPVPPKTVTTSPKQSGRVVLGLP